MTRYPELQTYADKQGAPITAFLNDGWRGTPVYHYCRELKRQRPSLESEEGKRWRYTDELKPKYGSVKDCKRVWYHLDRAIARAEKTGQPLILANGGAGATVANVKGLAATAINGGESTIPANLLDELKRKYPEGEIWIVFDCDDKGRKAAPAVCAQLRLAGYTARAIDLGLPGKGGDIADFLKLYPASHLADLPTLPEPVEQRQHRISQTDKETPIELINALATAYHAAPPNSNGWSRKNIVCPFHDDHDPSAGFNWKTGVLNCQVCGAHSPHAQAEHFGIDWRSFYPKPSRALHHTPTLRNDPRRTSETEYSFSKQVFTQVTEPSIAPHVSLSDAAILELANNLTAGSAMLARLMDILHDELPDSFCDADVKNVLAQAGYSMSHATIERSVKLIVGVITELSSKSHTKENPLQCDNLRKKGRPAQYYRFLSYDERMSRIKADILTRLIKAKFKDASTPIPQFSAKMLTDALGLAADTAQILAETLDSAAPLPASEQDTSAARLKEVHAEYRRIVQGLEQGSITRLKVAELPDKARRSPNAYLDTLRLEIVALHDGQQVSGRRIGALIGIHDHRAMTRKAQQLGIQRHEETLVIPIQDAAQIETIARKNRAYPLRIIATNQDGMETAAISAMLKTLDGQIISNPAAQPFIERQTSAGYTVTVKLQAASRIEIVEAPLPATAPAGNSKVAAPAQRIERPTPCAPIVEADPEPAELPGKFYPAWVMSQLLARFVRSAQGFDHPLTHGQIPAELATNLSDAIYGLTGLDLENMQQERTA